jgi:formylglycine-generating enzyme required for sulfatase activity
MALMVAACGDDVPGSGGGADLGVESGDTGADAGDDASSGDATGFCPLEERRCAGQVVEECQESRGWVGIQTCLQDERCDEGACLPSDGGDLGLDADAEAEAGCFEGERRCGEDQVEECRGGEFTSIDLCDGGAICRGAACILPVEGSDCDAEADCGDDGEGLVLYCGPDDFCYDGSAGDPCGDDDSCLDEVPLCGPEGCQVGVEGDPCESGLDCDSALYCGPDDACHDGSAGDPCSDDDECVDPICGPEGCQAGALGDPCEGALDCDAELDCDVQCHEPDFVRIAPGSFEMGCPPGEGESVDCSPNTASTEAHSVEITRPFYLAVHELTLAEWLDLELTSPADQPDDCDDCPVTRVNWYETLAYLNARSFADGLERCYDLDRCSGAVGDTGGSYECSAGLENDLGCTGYRLPTEAEWEYAARGGENTAFYWGALSAATCPDAPDVLLDNAWSTCNSGFAIHIVSALDSDDGREPNPWGLYDMAGNVDEWVWDIFDVYPEDEQIDPTGPDPDTGGDRVLRGGNFFSPPSQLQHGSRFRFGQDRQEVTLGFRVARTEAAE